MGARHLLPPTVEEEPVRPWLTRHKWTLLTLAIIAATVVLRGLALDQGLWLDEVFSMEMARLDWSTLLYRVGFFDLHPPVYYLLLSVWTAVTGTSEVAVRGLSLLFAAGTLLLLYRWAGRAGRWQGLLAVLLLGTWTLHVHYSVEVRSYSMATFLAAAFLFLYERILDGEDSRGSCVLLGVVEALLLLTHYYTAFLVLGANLHFFTVRRQRPLLLARWGITQTLVLAVYALWLPLILVQAFHLPEGMFRQAAGAASPVRLALFLGLAPVHPSRVVAVLSVLLPGSLLIARLVQSFRHPQAPRPVPPAGITRRPRHSGLIALALAAAVLAAPALTAAAGGLWSSRLPLLLLELPRTYVLLFAALFFLFLGIHANARGLTTGTRLEPMPFIFAVAALATATLYLLNRPFLPRNLLFFAPLAALLAARAWRPQRLLTMAATAALLLSLTVPSLWRMEGFFLPRQDFRSAAAAIQGEQAAGGSASFVLPMWDRPGLEYYLGTGTANGLMTPRQLPPFPTLPPTVNIVLTRQAFQHRGDFLESIAQVLGPAYQLTDRGGTFRRVHLAVFERRAQD